MVLLDPNDESQLRLLCDRYIEGAGFANRPGEKARPDATSWAILALQASGRNSAVIPSARKSLVATQAADGRVCVSSQHPDACWPTPLAVLAWLKSPEYEEPRKRALRFMLEIEKVTVLAKREMEGHDETIPGWPWIAGTHPWLEPTAYSLMALRLSGYLLHARTSQAIRLLVDRQLSAGGWNYGNTLTLGKEMLPMPETTGIALAAIVGLAPKSTFEKSFTYLKAQLPSLNTPMSLGWAILGLRAWQEPLDRAKEQILGVLARQQELGPYDTVSLSLLLLAYYCDAGLVRFLEAK